MSRTFKIKKPIAYGKIPILNSFELFYLRLFTHGLNPKEISEFLEIDQSKVYHIKKSIVTKFCTNNWVKIVAQSLKNNMLQKLDYLEPVVKEQALQYTQIIYKDFLIPEDADQQQSKLRQCVLNFYLATNSKLKHNYFKKDETEKLNAKELAYLTFCYADTKKDIIKKELNLHKKDDLKKLRRDIFKKLETNNWFNTFKKAIQYSLIDTSIGSDFSINKELTNSTNNILRLRHLKRLSNPEKKLSIYNELLELFSTIELSKIVCYEEEL